MSVVSCYRENGLHQIHSEHLKSWFVFYGAEAPVEPAGFQPSCSENSSRVSLMGHGDCSAHPRGVGFAAPCWFLCHSSSSSTVRSLLAAFFPCRIRLPSQTVEHVYLAWRTALGLGYAQPHPGVWSLSLASLLPAG